MKLDQAVEMYVAGALPANELPHAALESLASGLDSPALRQLAVATGESTSAIHVLLEKSLEELGAKMPSPSEAALAWATRISKAIIDHKIDPYVGAKQIWRDIYTQFPRLTQLRHFVGYASEYEDDELRRPENARLIMEECRRFLAGSGDAASAL